MTIQIRLTKIPDGEALSRRAMQLSSELDAREHFSRQIVSVEGFGPRAFEARIETRWPERQVIVNADGAEPLEAVEAAFRRTLERLAPTARRA